MNTRNENNLQWYHSMTNDPYEEYREQPQGCRSFLCGVFDAFIMIVVFALVMVAITMLGGCASVKPIEQSRDSVRIELRHDSVFVFQHDSVFRDRWRNGDTVFVTLEKWKVKYRDKIVEVHDTIRKDNVQTVVQEIVPTYYKRTSTGFWVLLAIVVAVAGYKISKIIIKIKSGGLL